jgi:adenosine deaminase
MMKSEPTWFELLPKIELHLHLEGAIPYAALWELVQKNEGHWLDRRVAYRHAQDAQTLDSAACGLICC